MNTVFLVRSYWYTDDAESSSTVDYVASSWERAAAYIETVYPEYHYYTDGIWTYQNEYGVEYTMEIQQYDVDQLYIAER